MPLSEIEAEAEILIVIMEGVRTMEPYARNHYFASFVAFHGSNMALDVKRA